MLNLATITSIVQLVTDDAVNAITVQASWTDLYPNAPTPGQTAVGNCKNTVITTADTTTIVPSPLANTDRNVKFLLITNTSNVSCTIVIQHFDGVNTVPIWVPGAGGAGFVLQAGWVLEYNTDGNGWVLYNAAGVIQSGFPSSFNNLGISAGTQSGSVGTFVWSNSNNVSFGLNGSTITASFAPGVASVNFSAGTTSNNLSAITFANGNGVSFGLDGSTLTASVAAAAPMVGTISCFSQDADFVTNFPVGQALLSFQKLSLPMNLMATQLAVLADFRGNALSSDAVTLNHAVYTISGSTAVLASSGFRTMSWASSQYTNASGTRYRTVDVSYSMPPGDYLFAWLVSTANGVVVRPFGRMAANIVGGFDGIETNQFLNGSSVSSVLAFPGTLAATNTNYARTGFSALLQPGAILLGTN